MNKNRKLSAITPIQAKQPAAKKEMNKNRKLLAIQAPNFIYYHLYESLKIGDWKCLKFS